MSCGGAEHASTSGGRSLFAAVSLVTSGCTVSVGGTAVVVHDELISVDNFNDTPESVMIRDTLTDLVRYWESRGVALNGVRYLQWDSREGDSPPMCHGSVFPQPAFCADGWLAWDIAWAKRSQRHPLVALVYASRAVSDAVAYTSGGEDSGTSAQECLMGAYMAFHGDATSREMRSMLTDVSAFVRGLESRNPLQDCAYL